MIQEAIEFTVAGTKVRGFVHLPEGVEKANLPLIVMGNGFATEWQFGTRTTIEAFTELGCATLNFDYRSFGISDGEPRQVVDTQGQLEDWRAALRFAQSLEWVDQSKIIIWGSSLGGGHAISMAAEFPACALIAQVPHCCSRAAFKQVSMGSVVKGMSKAIRDNIGSLFGKAPLTVPVVEVPEKYGVMNHAGWKAAYLKLAADSTTWKNAIPARSLLKAGDYRPILVADKVQCPALLVAGKKDSGVPFSAVEETVGKMPNGRLYAYDGDHFDVYQGELYPQILQAELDFIREQIV